ncbi:hypothetical protein EJB05_27504, partial [Eragrostis curvula]
MDASRCSKMTSCVHVRKAARQDEQLAMASSLILSMIGKIITRKLGGNTSTQIIGGLVCIMGLITTPSAQMAWFPVSFY